MRPSRTVLADLPTTSANALPDAELSDLRQMIGEFDAATYSDALISDLHEQAYRWLERELNAYLLPHAVTDYFDGWWGGRLETSVWTPYRPAVGESNISAVFFGYLGQPDGIEVQVPSWAWDFTASVPAVVVADGPALWDGAENPIRLSYQYRPPALAGPTGNEIKYAAEILTKAMFNDKYGEPERPLNEGKWRMMVKHLRRYGDNPFIG